MARKRYTVEQIITKLREADVELAFKIAGAFGVGVEYVFQYEDVTEKEAESG